MPLANSKIPACRQAANDKNSNLAVLDFELTTFDIVWCLEFWIWNFLIPA
jgi:hypothetical protein